MTEHSTYAHDWVTHHDKSDDLLPTLATLLNLTAQAVLDPQVDRLMLSKHLRDFTAIVLEMERRYRLEKRERTTKVISR
jgi:hypothetical protein